MNPYVYPGTDVYQNKLGITDERMLRKFEYSAASLNGAELIRSPVQGKYDIEHMNKINNHLLKEVYDWAGKPRTLDFAKDDPIDSRWTTPFAKARDVEQIASKISEDLAKKNELKGLDKKTFVNELNDVYHKLNYLHPYPEGNGRTTQLLISQLAKNAGYEIDFKSMDKNVWNLAAARGQTQVNLETGETRPGDKTFMRDVLEKHVRPLDLSAQRETDSVAKRSLSPAVKRTDESLSFEFDKPQDAVRKHPELLPAFAAMQTAKSFADTTLRGEEERGKFLSSVKQQIIEKIDNGLLKEVNRDKEKTNDPGLER